MELFLEGLELVGRKAHLKGQDNEDRKLSLQGGGQEKRKSQLERAWQGREGKQGTLHVGGGLEEQEAHFY